MSENRRLADLETKLQALGKEVKSATRAASELRDAVVSIIPAETLPKELRPSWIKRNVAMVAIIASLFGGSVTASLINWWREHSTKDLRFQINEAIDEKLTKPTETLNHHTEQLSAIKTSIDDLKHDLDLLLKKELELASRLPQKQFERNLELVAADFVLAHDNRTMLDHDLISEIRRRLTSSSANSAPYWHAATSFVTYNSVPLPGPAKLPSCLDKPPVVRLAKDIDATQTTIELTPAIYENCELVLDSVGAANVRAYFLNFTGLELRKCRVIYHGGDLLFPVGRSGTMKFVDCTFVLDVPGEPPNRAKPLIQALVAADDLRTVSVKVPG
jgi:hypothetical protein